MRMICLLLVLHLLSLLNSVLSSLPAPINLYVDSLNFNHVLRWDPGPGTPPGTQYKIIRRVNKKELKARPYTKMTSVKLKLPDSILDYDLTVQAIYNQTQSKESDRYPFSPYKDTTIGPPKVSLAGCGNCIQVNISLPEPDSSARIDDIHKFCGARFRVLWRKHGEAVESDITEERSYTLNNLKVGTEYCVRVETTIVTNKNTRPSAWNCTFTSTVEPSRVPVVVGAVGALLLFAVGVLFASMYCLYYTGFICKLKATLPRVLIEALSRGYTLTPERTIPDKISVETETQGRHLTPAAPQPATRGTNSDEDHEEEEEEEEGDNVYMVRDPELSSGQSSCQNSDVSGGNGEGAVSGNCGSLTVEVGVPEDEVTHEGLHHHDEAEAEGAEVSLMSKKDQTGAQEYVMGEEEEHKEDVRDSSGNINLFSVTLSALAASEEEEQDTSDSVSDFFKLEPLLPTDSTQTQRQTQPESDDQTTVALMLPTQEDFTAAGYEGRRLKTCDGQTQHEETQEEEEEEEEEEEFSGYMRHT